MSIPGSANPLLLASAAEAGAYSISRSVRLNSADSAYFSRTPASSGNRKTWTWAGWVKRSGLGNFFCLMSAGGNDNFGFSSADKFQFYFDSGVYRLSTQVFRDVSAWYHLVVVYDSPNATAQNRIRVYVNGSEITAWDTNTTVSQNRDSTFNATNQHAIARNISATSQDFPGYLADIHFIDGQALDPTSFGKFDATTGVWNPKAYTGTYGTNGFHLDFADNSAATAAAIGKDSSPNGNNWTPNNIFISSSVDYVSMLSVSSGGGTLSNAVRAFDGLLTTAADAYTGSSGPEGLKVTFPSPITANTSFKVYAQIPSSDGGEFIQFWKNNVWVATLENSSQGNSNSAPLVYDMGPGTYSSIEVKENATYPINALALYGIQVDGAFLIDRTANAAGNDSFVDSPTNGTASSGGDAGGVVVGNYATVNALDSLLTLSDGNLQCARGGISSWLSARATIGVTSGKWYWEVTPTVGIYFMFGLAKASHALTLYAGESGVSWGYFGNSGNKYTGANPAAYGSAYGVGDVIGVAFDADSGELKYYKNGAVQGGGTAAFTGLTDGPYFPIFSGYSTDTFAVNFGQRPFAYAAPAGFKSLNTANLPTPTILKGSDYFDTKLYTGNGSTQTISGLGFSPDLVWIKGRSGATDHALYDAVRGAQARLESNTTDAEATSDGGLTAFNSDGFALSTLAQVNTNSATYAGWCWDAGSSNSTNTQGSITSTVRVNASAGFSIVTYTSGASGSSVGHGLGVPPSLIIAKSRTASATAWVIYHRVLGKDAYILFTTGASATYSNYWGTSAPTSTTFSVSDSGFLNNTGDMVAYCFAPVAGYSNGFSYTGNGSTDGSFVYLGFRPRLILLKCSSTTGNWTLVDTAREGYNVDNDPLYPNLSNAEGTTDLLDITSNGFKLRTTDASVNSNAATYVGFAWAESPFQYARAR